MGKPWKRRLQKRTLCNKRLNTYRPKAPIARQEIKLSDRASRTGRGQTEKRGNSNRDWSANSEW